jgi:integrase
MALIAPQANQEKERIWVGTIDGAACTDLFQACLKKAKLLKMRFHDLRHACATLLFAQSVHLRLVMEILGHSQIAVTMNIYSHVIPACNARLRVRWMPF